MTEPARRLYTTKSDYAYDRVREMILDGRLQPGEVLNQASLAQEIGISTTPLREAMRRLKGEGLVELDAHRDGRVSALSAEEARDLLEIRRSLDPLAAGLAAERRTRSDIAAMRLAHQGLESLPNDPSYDQLVHHRRFHAAVYSASHNDMLISVLDDLWTKADRYRRMALQVDRGQEARDRKAHEHQSLLDLVIAGDSAGASALMREHIDTSLGAQAAWRLKKHTD
ncbi:GntR family transcriptional regulator [Kineosporia sp. NBRC 101677]|uniref:GntR family transcriptional regulator n=1 Tax=Kineosporia sp. NBRC 101677 TaxID=3032197 RepID=UPI0024A57F61|nr:GntR family transcriptional regulator [Kineosporia sp. NBRC 101677]GLY17094.1 GntR family transcriptional regulator [Kineosporia sp. NBRC 101677]